MILAPLPPWFLISKLVDFNHDFVTQLFLWSIRKKRKVNYTQHLHWELKITSFLHHFVLQPGNKLKIPGRIFCSCEYDSPHCQWQVKGWNPCFQYTPVCLHPLKMLNPEQNIKTKRWVSQGNVDLSIEWNLSLFLLLPALQDSTSPTSCIKPSNWKHKFWIPKMLPLDASLSWTPRSPTSALVSLSSSWPFLRSIS